MQELFDKLRPQLRRDEGEVLHAYQDHLGYWTIGVGRLIDKRRGGGITPEESACLLENDINSKYTELKKHIPWIDSLDIARQGVLVNMAFQLGINGLLQFRNTLDHVKQGKYMEASILMLDSLWARQTPNRAKRMAEQMRTGEWI